MSNPCHKEQNSKRKGGIISIANLLSGQLTLSVLAPTHPQHFISKFPRITKFNKTIIN
jgi:hypothetical protein